jgi:hypothetical protein
MSEYGNPSAREPVDVGSDPQRVAVRVRVSLVDDVCEGLQRVQRLLPRAAHARVGAADRERDRNHGEHVPRVIKRKQGHDRAEPRLGRRAGEIGSEHLEPAHDLDQAARDQ